MKFFLLVYLAVTLLTACHPVRPVPPTPLRPQLLPVECAR